MALLGWALTAALAAGCGGGGESAPPEELELETARPGVLTAALDVSPQEGDDLEGFEVDLVEEIGRRLGLDAQVQEASPARAVGELGDGEVDLVAPAIREAGGDSKVALSAPYLPAGESLAVARGSDIQSFDDLTGQTVGVVGGARGADYARRKTDAARVRRYADLRDALNGLRGGRVAAVVHDSAATRFAERSDRAIEVVDVATTGGEYRLAVAPPSDALLAAVDEALAEIKADGAYERIYRTWLDGDPPEEIVAGEG